MSIDSTIPHTFDDLRRVVAGRVYTPGDPEWDTVRRPWALAVEQMPLAVVEVADADDVRGAVRWAADNGRQVTAQPIGHGARGSIDQVLLLRTRALNAIKIDLPSMTATIGAGVKAGELLQALEGTGLTFLAGSNPDPTVVGMTITGGMSWFGRAYGLAANAVESFELVDGLGRFRQVSRTDDADLFWALRGGGGDFGVITSLQIRLFPAPELFGGKLLWPIEQMPAVLRAFRQITEHAPDTLTLWFHHYQFPPIPTVPDVLRGKAFAAVALTYLGPQSEAEALIAPLRAIPGLVLGHLGPVPMHELASVADEPVDPAPIMQHSLLLHDLGDDVLDGLGDRLGAGSQSPLAMAKIMHLGGRLRSIDVDNGACGHVDEPFLLFAMGMITGPDAGAAIRSAFAELDEVLAAHTDGRTVPNFMGADDDLDRVWSSTTRQRLAAIKRRVDPTYTIRSNRPTLRSPDGRG